MKSLGTRFLIPFGLLTVLIATLVSYETCEAGRTVILAGAFALLFASSLVVFRFVVTGRLHAMARHFNDIATHPEGPSPSAIKAWGSDEIGAVGAGFNRVVEHLRATHTSLEIAVNERTAELRSANERLQVELAGCKRAEQLLRGSRLEYRTLFEHIPQKFLHKDRESTYISCNDLFARDLGIPAADVAGKTDFDFFPRELAEKYRADDRLVIETGREIEVEEDYVEDGNSRTVLTRKVPLLDDNGEVRGVIGVFTDITDRKRAEDLIRIRLSLLEFAASHSLEELLQKTVDDVGALTNSPIGFYHFLESDQKTLSLQAWSTRTTKEFCKAEGVGLHYNVDQAGVWVDCVSEKRPVIHNDLSKLSHRKGLPMGHTPVIRELVVPIMRSGLIVAILGVGNKLTDYDDRDAEVVSYLADVAWEIAKRKRAEKKLHESGEELRRERALLRTIIDSMQDLIFFKDKDSVYLGCNKAFEVYSGMPEGVLIGKTDVEIAPREAAESHRRMDREMLASGKAWRNEEWIPFKKGGGGHFDMLKTPYYGPDGELLGLIGVGRDITENKRMREAIEKRLIALTRPLDATEGIEFEDLFNIEEIQKLQDQFATACGVGSLITHLDGTPITNPSNFCRLCDTIIRGTEKGLRNCRYSDTVIGVHHPEGPVFQPCLSSGLWDAGANITVGGRHIANWLVGQVRDETQKEAGMRPYAREIGADEEAFIEAFNEVPSMSKEQFEKVAHALFTLAGQLSSLAYHNVQQARFITDRKQAEDERRRLEDRLQRAEKMEALGTLAGGVAHDLNNVLGIVVGYSETACK